VSLIHQIVEGGEKLRMRPDASLRDRADLHCWPISTGEDVPDTDPASLARQLIVEFTWRGGWNDDLGAAQDHGEHLPAIGLAWIRWLETKEAQEIIDQVTATYTGRRKAWNQFLMRERPDMSTMPRIADNLATNAVVAEIATHCPAIAPALAPRYDTYAESMKNLARDMGDYTSSSMEAWRFLRSLRSLYAGGRISMTQRRGEVEVGDDRTHVGWFDDDGYYLIADLAVAAVQQLEGYKALSGISKRTLYEQIAEMGFLAKTGSNSTTRKVRVGTSGKHRRVLHLTRGAIDGVPGN